ncbi:MAG: hypothetical protein NY202_03095 [Mollicutes bacterium UO1]
MVFKYFLKIDRTSIKLGQADKDNEVRIKQLEQKNGHDQQQIEQLKEQINKLERSNKKKIK